MKPRNFPARLLYALAMLPLVLQLASCATTGSHATKPAIDREAATCAALQPIYVSNADVLTDQTARAILANDETWQRLCRNPKGNTP